MCKNRKPTIPVKTKKMEQWRDYYTYKVSDKGRIVNRFGREVKGYIATESGKKYRVVVLRFDKKRIHRKVGALVYRLFTGYEGNARVRHLDGNFDNCSLDNLAIARSYTEAPSAEQLNAYEKNVVACVKDYFNKQGWIELQRLGLDIDNALGNAYLLVYRYLPQYSVGTSFYVFASKYARWAFLVEYKRYKREQDYMFRLIKNKQRLSTY